jgi:ADP-ribose pyrophosphatase
MPAMVNTSETIHNGRVFKLITENITLENGVVTDMDYIQHPGATAIVALKDHGHLIMLKQYRHALNTYIWEIPAGTLDSGETIDNCAQRELVEETGYSADQWHRLGEITPVPGYSNERIHIYLATELKPAARNLDDDEMITVHEIKFDAAVEMIKNGEIQDSKTIASLFLASIWLKENDASCETAL